MAKSKVERRFGKNKPLIHIKNCQVKSQEKAELLCHLLDTLEKEFGIKEVEISFKNIFICPDINISDLYNSIKPMEKLVGGIFLKLTGQW